MRKKIMWILLGYLFLATIGIPWLVTMAMGGFQLQHMQEAKVLYGLQEYMQAEQKKPKPQKRNDTLEAYVAGVVAAEMPASFPDEALKAQAVAARTYQVRKMEETGSKQVLYDVGQAYADEATQRKKWGKQYETYAKRIKQLVAETENEIMVYEGEPILAVFHAQSCGKTENSENVWVQKIPYLKSVDSHGDLQAPDNTITVTKSAKTVKQALSCYGDVGVSAEALSFDNIKRSPAGYIQQVTVGNKTLTGLQVRQALGLRSADFTVTRNGDDFVFTTKGYGHGAGMSQYGAKALADEGMTYHAILQHYYTGISFDHIV